MTNWSIYFQASICTDMGKFFKGYKGLDKPYSEIGKKSHKFLSFETISNAHHINYLSEYKAMSFASKQIEVEIANFNKSVELGVFAYLAPKFRAFVVGIVNEELVIYEWISGIWLFHKESRHKSHWLKCAVRAGEITGEPESQSQSKKPRQGKKGSK